MLFRGGELPPEFARAALVACLLAGADHQADPMRLVSDIATRLRFPAAAAIRLAARCRLARAHPLTPARLKFLVSALGDAERAAAAELAVAVASDGGEPSHGTVAALERLHDLCGVDRRTIYVALHRNAAAAARPASDPVVVEEHKPRRGTFRIPPPPPPPQRATEESPWPARTPMLEPARPGFVIDTDRVAAILRETRQVTEVLASIYQEPETALGAAPAGQGPAAPDARRDAPPTVAPAQQPVPAGLAIDMGRVAAIQRETRAVAEVLASIYQNEETTTGVAPAAKAPAAVTDSLQRFPGLGDEHARLLTALAGRESWSRDDFEELGRSLGLMPDGAIETINDWGFDTFDEAVIENGDPLTINVTLLPAAPEGTT